jgi:hypothetical protein
LSYKNKACKKQAAPITTRMTHNLPIPINTKKYPKEGKLNQKPKTNTKQKNTKTQPLPTSNPRTLNKETTTLHTNKLDQRPIKSPSLTKNKTKPKKQLHTSKKTPTKPF